MNLVRLQDDRFLLCLLLYFSHPLHRLVGCVGMRYERLSPAVFSFVTQLFVPLFMQTTAYNTMNVSQERRSENALPYLVFFFFKYIVCKKQQILTLEPYLLDK